MFPDFYILRHGQTVWNAEGRYQGSLDSPLTDKGKEQARLIGRLLRARFGERCTLPLFLSPLPRVQETAFHIRKEINFSRVTTDERLTEISMGLWEGRKVAEVANENPQLVGEFRNNRAILHAPQGESLEEAEARVRAFLADRKGPFIVLCHGLLSKLLRAIYGSLSRDEMLALVTPQDAFFHLHDGVIDRISQ